MKHLMKLWIPGALLALASMNASATTCASLAGSSLAAYQSAASCTIGDLTFSNFQFEYSTTVSRGSANVPDPSASTFVTISETNDPGTCDPNGTCGSSTHALYQLITDFSSDGNTTGSASVSYDQSESLAIQYQVSVAGGHFVSEIDGAGLAGVSSDSTTASATFEKDVCYGQSFFANTAAHPVILNDKCANNTFPNSTPVDIGFSSFASDPTTFANMDQEASGLMYAQGTLGSTFGVYDVTTLNGGSQILGSEATASAGSQENDFVEATTAGGSTPEPGTFVLLGGALIGVGVLRRRKKTA